jgi:hypothetical protein
MPELGAIYRGEVVHRRLRPVLHGLSYRVFALLVDCEALPTLGNKLRLFSYNRFNLFSIHDRDHGDGTTLLPYLRNVAEQAGLANEICRFSMLCYPRLLGYVFNPITVYFGIDKTDRTRLVIYEVNNTFGERKTYVLPADPDHNNHIWQRCPKQFFVSPFNNVSGHYDFHISPIQDELTVGVGLKDNDTPVLRAHFRGKRHPLSDAGLLSALMATGPLTLKVLAGIHVQALKLWFKGLRIQAKPPPPINKTSYFVDPRSGIERQTSA